MTVTIRDESGNHKILPSVPIVAPVTGIVISISVDIGQVVEVGQPIIVIESMKMEYVVHSAVRGVVARLDVAQGETVEQGTVLAAVARDDANSSAIPDAQTPSLDVDESDLTEVARRHALTLDDARPASVSRRAELGRRTARQNISDLCDPGSFAEYGQLVVAAQRRDHSLEELIEISPADGLVTGIGHINGSMFPGGSTQCVVMSYDYTVFAGTQGIRGHFKSDRMFELANSLELPLVLFAEGGGGRPNDTEGGSGEVVRTFTLLAELSGRVPLVGIASGRCFAGNALLLGCCDVVISTPESTIGMGGPAMIEGGGLGRVRPEDVGPASVQFANGVIDIKAQDEADAVRAAKQYLSYFQGRLSTWSSPDQGQLRQVVPKHRRRVYDVRDAITILADTDSVLELRQGFGSGMVTALARFEGRPVGVVANNPLHQGGAIDASAADKAARFLQLCDAFALPVLFLCDTPGIMVGPEAEAEALVRHASRLFLVGASVRVPLMTVVLRKSYGLGALAMAGGGNKMPAFNVAWPTGEFGGMGVEGAVRLGHRKELDAIDDPSARRRRFEELVAQSYLNGGALEMASKFVIDDVIDPAETRRWVLQILTAAPPPEPPPGHRRQLVDSW